MLVSLYGCECTAMLVKQNSINNCLMFVYIVSNLSSIVLVCFSYDLEFTVAQNLVAVSSGNLLYQVRTNLVIILSMVTCG